MFPTHQSGPRPRHSSREKASTSPPTLHTSPTHQGNCQFPFIHLLSNTVFNSRQMTPRLPACLNRRRKCVMRNMLRTSSCTPIMVSKFADCSAASAVTSQTSGPAVPASASRSFLHKSLPRHRRRGTRAAGWGTAAATTRTEQCPGAHDEPG